MYVQIQTLGRKTVQMLLQNNMDATLLSWVIDHCYDSKPACAQLCFHALCNTLASKYVSLDCWERVGLGTSKDRLNISPKLGTYLRTYDHYQYLQHWV